MSKLKYMIITAVINSLVGVNAFGQPTFSTSYEISLKETPSSVWKFANKSIFRPVTAWPLYLTTNGEICLLTKEGAIKIVKTNELTDECQQYIRSIKLPNKSQFDELKQSGKLIESIDDDLNQTEKWLKPRRGTSGQVLAAAGLEQGPMARQDPGPDPYSYSTLVNVKDRNKDLIDKKRAIMSAMNRL